MMCGLSRKFLEVQNCNANLELRHANTLTLIINSLQDMLNNELMGLLELER
jgi:hypothetical protein